jgi:hypothetical protein
MPPEVQALIISKLEKMDPLDSGAFFRIVLEDKSIQKIVLDKLTKIVGSTNLEKVFNTAAAQIQQSVNKIRSAADAASTIVDDLSTKSKKSGSSSSKDKDKAMLEFLKVLGLSLTTGKRGSSIEPILYKTKKDELELSESSIKKFAKVAGLSSKETDLLLKKLKTTVDHIDDNLGLLDSFLKRKSGGFLDLLISFGKLLLSGGLAILLSSSFGPAITGVVDRIFGTNLTGLFAPYRQALAKWQGYIDMFGKYSVEIGLLLLNGASGFKKLLTMGVFGGRLSKGITEASKIVKPGIIERLKLAAGIIKVDPLKNLPAMERDAKGVIRIAKGVKDASGVGIGGRMVSKEAAAAFEAAEKAAAAAAAKAASMGFIGKSLGNITSFIGKATSVVGNALKFSGFEKIGGSLLGKIGGKLFRRIPFVGALISFGLGIKKIFDGDVIGGMFDITSALVGFIPFVGIPLSFAIDLLGSAVTNAAGGDKNKKGDVISTFFKNLMKNFLRTFVNFMPESFGIRAAVAKFLGVDIGAAGNENITPPVNPQMPTKPSTPGDHALKMGETFSKDQVTPEFLAKHPGLKWFQQGKDKSRGFYKNTIEENQEQQSSSPPATPAPVPAPAPAPAPAPTPKWHVGSTPPKFWVSKEMEEAAQSNSWSKRFATNELHPELKQHLSSLSRIMSDMSLSFKDYQNAMSQANNSIVSINNTSVSDGGSEGFFMGSRDPLFETRFAYKNLK